MTNEQAREMLIRTLDEVVGVLNNGELAPKLADASREVRIDEIEIDSLSAIEWGMTIERETGLEVDVAELRSFDTLDDLAAHLARRGS